MHRHEMLPKTIKVHDTEKRNKQKKTHKNVFWGTKHPKLHRHEMHQKTIKVHGARKI